MLSLIKKTTIQRTSPIAIAHATNACDQTSWYEPDDGPLTERQIANIRKLAPQVTCVSIRSSLFWEPIAD